MKAFPLFTDPILEAEAQVIIAPRRIHIAAFAQHHVGAQRNDAALWAHFRAIEPALAPADYLPLAQQIAVAANQSLVDHVREVRLQRLWRTNAFRIPGHNPRKKAPPRDSPVVAALLDQVQAILAASNNVTTWVHAFTAAKLFQNDHVATQAAYAFAQVPRIAARQARWLVQTWLQTDDSALLQYAQYPYMTELAYLQALVQEAARQCEGGIDTTAVLPVLRTDVVCLVQVLQNDDLNQHYQLLISPYHTLYDASLWHQPSTSTHRTHYQARLPEEMGRIIVAAVAHRRTCDAATAAQIFDCYRNQRLANLVTWRCQQQHPTLDLQLVRGRTRRAAVELIAGLPQAAQQTILARLNTLQDAADAAGIALAWHKLVRDPPGSHVRRHAQQQRLPNAVFDHFAQHAGVPRRTAKSLIKQFMIYGPLGLVPRRTWRTLVHPTLWSYVHLHKLGRLEGMRDYPRLTETYNAYAQRLTCRPLPQQFVTALCNHFPKDRYYNSGDGEATTGVPRRKSLKLAGVLRLHEAWLLLAVPVAIDLVDHGLRSCGTVCMILCVFDCGSERPTTCCVYPGTISATAIGLTLYDAIWHPHTIEWPLRGLPEQILVPVSVAPDDLVDICNAAYWMHARVVRVSNADLKKQLARYPFIRATIAALQARYTPAKLSGRRRAPRLQLTVQEAQTDIREWVREYAFTHDHRIEHACVPKALRDQGYIMPGFDTVVAGYLLPVIATDVPTVRDGVVYQGRRYAHPDAAMEPGSTVSVRAWPQDNQRPTAVFAAYGDPPGLRYLRLTGSIERV